LSIDTAGDDLAVRARREIKHRAWALQTTNAHPTVILTIQHQSTTTACVTNGQLGLSTQVLLSAKVDDNAKRFPQNEKQTYSQQMPLARSAF
jgi:hypothetical protein